MPNDTTYYNKDGRQVPFDSLPPGTQALVRQSLQASEIDSTRQNPDGYLLTLTVLLLVAFFIVRLIKHFTNAELPADDANVTTVNSSKQVAAAEEEKEFYIYPGNTLGLKEEDITRIIIKHYPFYNRLWPTVQYRFQQRLVNFINSKSFIIYSQQPYKEMPVLVSAAAIHLTLGLDGYMLPWFKNICIHPEAYFAKDALRVLAGNVEGNTITVAWDQLLKGINNETDGNNVGLHEMAHALYYQQVEADKNKEANFSVYFEMVMQEGEEVYKLKDASHLLYTDYAYRNLQEFWAESVEIFFEKPADMQRCYPGIYETIKGLLKQDPLNKGNPLC